MKVFWSWQDDFSPDSCRHFIRNALADAVQAVGEELGLDDAERPALDHDTKDAAGMVDIVATILQKISEAAVFVADLTPIGRSESGKAVPNPNVLVELGWAFQKPGPERIIAIINTASGFKPEDLPFDIRHRRILTYDLADKADKPTRIKARSALAKSLTVALQTNLRKHLKTSDSEIEILGVAASANDPSIWETATDVLEHSDTFGKGHRTAAAMPVCPRAYIRVIPQGWADGAPTVSDIAELQYDKAVVPQPEGTSSGDSGPFKDGYAHYWITKLGTADQRETKNVAAYLEETGEFWVLHGTAIEADATPPRIYINRMLGGWSKALRRAMAVLDSFKALPNRRVEVGLVRVEGVRWPGRFDYDSPPARKGRFLITHKQRNWDSEAQLAFLWSAYNGVRNLFALSKTSKAEFQKVLAASDSERERWFSTRAP